MIDKYHIYYQWYLIQSHFWKNVAKFILPIHYFPVVITPCSLAEKTHVTNFANRYISTSPGLYTRRIQTWTAQVGVSFQFAIILLVTSHKKLQLPFSPYYWLHTHTSWMILGTTLNSTSTKKLAHVPLSIINNLLVIFPAWLNCVTIVDIPVLTPFLPSEEPDIAPLKVVKLTTSFQIT